MRASWPWRHRLAWSPLRKPLSQSTLVLISSNAYLARPLHRLGPFEFESRFRPVSVRGRGSEPDERPLGELDPAQVQDMRLLTILDRVRPLVDSGRLGGLSSRHLSLSGAVVTSGRLVAETRRTALPQLTEDEVDIALLVPT